MTLFKVDLLPKVTRRTATRRGRGARSATTRRHRWIVSFVIALLLLAPIAWSGYQLQASVAKLERATAEMEQRIGELTPVSDLLVVYEALTEELRSLQALLQARDHAPRFIPYLSELARLLPAGAALSDITFAQERLVIRGHLPSYSEAASFLQALAASEYFAQPHLSFLHQEAGRYRFELTAQLRQGAMPR
jgi:Tfp pilus assembly protein PilN